MAKYKIIPSSRTIVQSPISIGHKAEKGVEAIEFDLTAWVETYGSGTLTVIMRRWGDAIPYPIALEIDENNKATWTLSDTDTAKAGMAYAQLSYIVGDEVVKKSDIYTFRVMDSLTGEGEPPEAYESWLEHLTHLAAEAMAEVLDIEGVATDKTLTVDGGIADAKATGEALAKKVDAADYSELSDRVGRNTIALAEKADRSTTYTKTEVDALIDEVEVETDTTLEIAGAPADAAETGRQIGLLKADLANNVNDLKSHILHDVNSTGLWENGSFSASTGSQSPNAARLRTITYIDNAVSNIEVPTGYRLIIYGWDGSTYLGVWSGTGFSTSATKKWSAGKVSAIDINQYNLRLCLERTDGANISVDESAGVRLYETVDKTLTVNGMPADAKSVGNRLTSLRTDLENQLSDKADKSVQNLFTEKNVSVNLLDTSNAVTGAIMADGSISEVEIYALYKTAYVKLPAGTYTEYAFATATGSNFSTYRRIYLIKKVSDGTTTYVNQNNVQSTQFTLDEESEVWYSRGTYNNYQTIDRAMIVEGTTITQTYIPHITEKVLDTSVVVGSGNVLFGKKWCPCGDSFTAYTDEFFTDGRYFGKYKTYPYLISERNGINLVETFFASGRTLAMPASPGTFINSLCNPSAAFYYQNIPSDVDIITIYLGINDAHHAPGSSGGDGEDNTGEIPIGTVNDTTTATYGGAWNVILSWLMENRPNAHIGIIVSNGMNDIAYRELTLTIAKKYGLSYIDLNGDHLTSAMSRPQNTDIADSVKTILRNKWSIDPVSNTHPNASAHLFESYMIEDFLRRL